jgi:hypothetical protein
MVMEMMHRCSRVSHQEIPDDVADYQDVRWRREPVRSAVEEADILDDHPGELRILRPNRLRGYTGEDDYCRC